MANTSPMPGASETVRGACPHDCPSACSLGVERLRAYGNIGQLHLKLRNSTPFKQLLPLIEPIIIN